jgi:putative tricarboxylic transport membrane protein
MSATSQRAHGPNHRLVELVVAAVTGIFGVIVMYGSSRVGVGWDSDGPGAGFFPFYVGAAIVIASIVNFVQVWQVPDDALFAEWPQLRQVLFVVIPTAIYVSAIPFIGIYVSSAILIAFFMRWLGNYGVPMIAGIAVGVPIVTFLVFEKWFLVPLPKGPLENLLGY